MNCELVFMWLYNEYHLQESGKENIAAPAASAQSDGCPKLKGPAKKTKKSRVHWMQTTLSLFKKQ